MKVALYERVSTDDQARHGISIEAQQAALREWAEKNGHTIIGEYTDAGISGKKPPNKRPALSKLFKDLERGLKVEVLAFCKLDRFFRSVKLYYQAVDVLDKYHVAWQAIHEDYETVTASGRMKVNIMLSVAENEADRTSERIKTVFQHKIDKGEAITRCQPFGYKLDGKKVVPDEHAEAAKDMFSYFAQTGNTYATRDMLQNKWGARLSYESVYRFLQNPIYTGRYRNNPNYCQPLVSQEMFDRIQLDFEERRKTKRAPSGRVYLFSGLVVCAECGRHMTVSYNKNSTLQPIRYRCPAHLMEKVCRNNKNISEYKIEQELLSLVSAAVAGISADFTVKQSNVPSVNRQAVERKLERLKELYIDGDISKADYTAQKEKLTALLQQPIQKKKSNIVSVVGDDFMRDYEGFSLEQRRDFWHSIIDSVVVDSTGHMEFIFME